MATIAFLGLGAMGKRMAAHLTKSHEVRVYNRTKDAALAMQPLGAQVAATPKEAATGADVVISMVKDNDASKAVWLDAEHGALHGLKSGAIALECSTVTPEWVAELAPQIASRGARLLDAPVAGTTPQAEAGQLIFMVGGDVEAFQQAMAVMQAMAAKVVHVGESGQGALLKLAVNTLFATQIASLAEVLNALHKNGMPAQRAMELLGGMPITSPAVKGVAQLILNEDHAPKFPVRLVAKDLRYAASLGRMPLTKEAQALFEAAGSAGFNDANISAIHAWYSHQNG